MIVGHPSKTGRGVARGISSRTAIFLVAIAIALAGLVIIGVMSRPWSDKNPPARFGAELAVPLALSTDALTSDASQLERIAADEARRRNAEMPLSDTPVLAARPLSLVSGAPLDWSRSVECLTAAVYYESATEPEDGQRAVAQVVLNRVRHPLYPKTICDVVYQGHERTTGCQFTFTCDGSLARKPMAALWIRARRIAELALAGSVYAPVGWSTNYHADYVLPYWAGSLLKTATVGAHIFYRLPSRIGEAGAFSIAYRGHEPEQLLPPPEALAGQGGEVPWAAPATLGERPVIDMAGGRSEGAAVTDKAVRAPVEVATSRWVIGNEGGRPGGNADAGARPAAAVAPPAMRVIPPPGAGGR